MSPEVETNVTFRIRPERGATIAHLRRLFHDLDSDTPSVLSMRLEPFTVSLSQQDGMAVRKRLKNPYCPFHEDLSVVEAIYSE